VPLLTAAVGDHKLKILKRLTIVLGFMLGFRSLADKDEIILSDEGYELMIRYSPNTASQLQGFVFLQTQKDDMLTISGSILN